ncbi:hypothetical protein BOX15_Mlig005410g2 [Macrostomum lignano]|uniref:Uncharacterized protein n=1 Tax=Macrostomum lignano TaxID=282301 RepID=A0A267FSM6_9PLAT|nr:hypothetical protein BOX15_Mlig005410g2 [Macrostomum lignano]
MTHILSWGDRHVEDNDSECVDLQEASDQPIVDVSSCRVPCDAAFLKHFTPRYIKANGSKPRYMWASREFYTAKDLVEQNTPAYTVSGFGLLDACLHAYASNATLVLHPLDILLNLCYTYGNHRKNPIRNNNEELAKITQIRLKRPFTRSHLILAAVARLARRVETYPLPKLFRLINTELNSPDHLVVRLAIGMLCYLAGTKETTRLTVEHMRGLFELEESSETLMEPLVHNNWTIAPTGVLDVRHEPQATASRRLRSLAKDVNNQQATARKSSQSREGAIGDLMECEVNADAIDVLSTSAVEWTPKRLRPQRDQLVLDDASEAGVQLQATRNGQETEGAMGGTNEMRVNGGEWRTMLDARLTEDGHGSQDSQQLLNRAGVEANAAGVAAPPPSTTQFQREFYRSQRNNANRPSVIEAQEWAPKKITPGKIYDIKKENGIQSVKFLGSRRAWVELPEMMFELCTFFGMERRVINEIVDIGKFLQTSRLNMNQQCRKFWSNILFKNGQPKTLPEADYQIDGWLSTLLGARLFSDQSGMNLRHLVDMKTGVRLPVLLVRLPNKETHDSETGMAPAATLSAVISDDSVLDGTDLARQKTRLIFYDEYREKLLLNSSGNACEEPVGLFMPWRSCEAVNRTRRLWRHIGGDSPAVSRPLSEALRGQAARNLNNVDSQTTVSRRSDITSVDDELAVHIWTIRNHNYSKSRFCCGCRSKRVTRSQSEPAYNMCCLMSGMCGFTLQPVASADSTQVNQSVPKQNCVRPICFFEIVFEGD